MATTQIHYTYMMLPSCQPEETVDTYMSFMERSGLSSFSYFFMAIPEVDPFYAQETPPGFSGHSKARMLAIWRSQEEAFNDGIFFHFISLATRHGFLETLVWLIELDDGKILTGKPYIWW